ncbi:hypothetical protein EKG37_01635 [Robertmurraya yapensis]|uniref:Uncharacterized protein n=2 Tax=Bacillaceae TaxID=186817 RepID=A0A431WLH1_9BACI|nr:hypothetical protein [Bacillus yapensis]RTR36286.1 hypothetical protein EKG37_01635 [Bacillus yapensis]TKT05789.1 hypothetical protein FAR12_01635 [Bacillus yapensis]
MDIIKEEIEKQIRLRTKEEKKELLKEVLIEAIKDGGPQNFIEKIIKKGNFTRSEVEKIYEEIHNE